MGSLLQHVRQLSDHFLGGKDGWVAVLTAYMDESGVHDDSPVLTVAAYLGRPEDWQRWANRWVVAKWPIKVYHATEGANLTGEFKGWSEAARDTVVKRVLPVLAEAKVAGMVVGIQMDEFRKALAGQEDLKELIGNPYGACFQWAIESILILANRVGSTETIAFVHENNSFKHDALAAFDFVRSRFGDRRTLTLSFGTKADFMPLQAADILAYEGNKRLRDPKRPERRPWKALNMPVPGKPRLWVLHYGKSNMGVLVGHMRRIREAVARGEVDFIKDDGTKADWR